MYQPISLFGGYRRILICYSFTERKLWQFHVAIFQVGGIWAPVAYGLQHEVRVQSSLVQGCFHFPEYLDTRGRVVLAVEAQDVRP